MRILVELADDCEHVICDFRRRSIREVVQNVDSNARIGIGPHREQSIPHALDVPFDLA